MLRTTTTLRSDLVRVTFRSIIRTNVVRCLAVECVHRKHLQRPQTRKVPHVVTAWTQQVRLYADYPDHIAVTLPALSPTMETGSIVSWHKKEGDKLNEGDLLAEIETDKATMGFETPEEGYLAKIVVPAGSKNVPIGQLVCVIVSDEGSVAAFKNFKDDGGAGAPAATAASPVAPAAAIPASATPPSVAPSPAPVSAASSIPAAASGDRIYASPLARRLASEKGLNLQGLKGTGLYASVTSKDLAGASATSTASSPSTVSSASMDSSASGTYTDIPVSNIRGVIAKRLLESKQNIPHYYLTVDVKMDAALQMREQFNKMLEKEKVKLSVNDIIIKAIAMASKKVPDGNTAWLGDVIRQYHNVDVSVAVSTDNGLITPIVFAADTKGIVQISKEVKALAAKARDGKLQPHEFQGGTITVSNLGMFGIKTFSAIINPPQSIILAVGTTESRLIPAQNEKGFESVNFMSVTASCDHRTVDGAVGAQWLVAFKNLLENPTTMLL
ncbi:dihydrolipoyllysine-residue acetyltransferase component of pyruvate dehydrogenase complex, mitochondrial isoform X2 [Athalia rosae]|uniref:dihydrolipoyllysine-residue acetyltransferase component of pyruvate dehydrogenase complex, mitochondrial isoform X2 n=1 Tax=Athalia rosae TaxID=37344 RepID=UPI000626B8FC|nr:dihydrolipoyllysine-residue acetyltransferase component of pyruvate dehydrogenase complex, mitochondrial isoform X2 [Athalia rosae]